MIHPKKFSLFLNIQATFYNAKESLSVDDPILMNQVHGADVIFLTEKPTGRLDCDALITKEPNLKLTVKTADCTPVLLADPQNHIVGAVHAGWKGAFQGILENTIFAMIRHGAELKNIIAAVGPHLTQASFQVTENMVSLFPKTEMHFFKNTENGTYFDFTGYVVHRLNRIGISNVEVFDIDTFQNTDYNSYRRDPQNPARQYSVIYLTEGANHV